MSIRNALATTRAGTRTIQDSIRNAALEESSPAIHRHLSQTAERAATLAQQIILLLEAAQEAQATEEQKGTTAEAAKLATLERQTAAITGEKGSKKR